jgi:hypothetical protein
MQEFNNLNILKEIKNIDELNGVLYKDIKNIIASKEELENTLFSTKIIFTNQSELIEFMNKLIEFGYENIALDYAENAYGKIVFDFSNLKIYENNNK